MRRTGEQLKVAKYFVVDKFIKDVSALKPITDIVESIPAILFFKYLFFQVRHDNKFEVYL